MARVGRHRRDLFHAGFFRPTVRQLTGRARGARLRIDAAITRHLGQAGFRRSVAAVAGGSALGQLATVVSSPILSRLYTPKDFGIYGVFVAILGVCAVVSAVRYE